MASLKTFFKTFVVLLAVSLVAYAFSLIGKENQVIDSFWKLFAFDLGFSILAAIFWPALRGVRKGDAVVAAYSETQMNGGNIFSFLNTVFATALDNGRAGQKIGIRFANGRRADALITGYASTFSAAQVKVVEQEAVFEKVA